MLVPGLASADCLKLYFLWPSLSLCALTTSFLKFERPVTKVPVFSYSLHVSQNILLLDSSYESQVNCCFHAVWKVLILVFLLIQFGSINFIFSFSLFWPWGLCTFQKFPHFNLFKRRITQQKSKIKFVYINNGIQECRHVIHIFVIKRNSNAVPGLKHMPHV